MFMRWIIPILVVFLSFPFVSAELFLDSFSSSSYNLGDQILLSGEVVVSNPVRGYLSFDLECEDGSARLATLLVDFQPGAANSFSKSVVLPSYLEGFCSVDVVLQNRDKSIIDSGSFDGFNVSRALDVYLDIPDTDFQLGDELRLFATVSKKDSSPVDGLMTVHFKQENESLFFETVSVQSGSAQYINDLRLIPDGEYYLDVEITDTYGNSYYASDAAVLFVRADIDVSLSLDKELYLPGSTVVLKGNLLPHEGSSLQEMSAYLYSSDLNISLTKYLGNQVTFDFDFVLPETIPSGSHVLNLVVKDISGNYGSFESSYSVEAVPSVLSLVLDKANFLPEEDIAFSVELLDQAGAVMGGTVTASLFKGDLEEESLTENLKKEAQKEGEKDKGISQVEGKVVDLSSGSSFTLPRLALPGKWVLLVQGFGLEDRASLEIAERLLLDYEISENLLTLKNLGNVPYQQDLVFTANGVDYNVPVSLPLEGAGQLDLGDYLDSGVYSLYFPLGEKTFDDVAVVRSGFFGKIFGSVMGITGNAVARVDGSSGGWRVFALLFLGLVVLVSAFFVFKKPRDPRNLSAHHQSFDPKEHFKYLKLQRKRNEYQEVASPQKKKFTLGKATEEDFEYHRNRVKEIFEREKQEKEKKDVVDPHKPREGLFGMFG